MLGYIADIVCYAMKREIIFTASNPHYECGLRDMIEEHLDCYITFDCHILEGEEF